MSEWVFTGWPPLYGDLRGINSTQPIWGNLRYVNPHPIYNSAQKLMGRYHSEQQSVLDENAKKVIDGIWAPK